MSRSVATTPQAGRRRSRLLNVALSLAVGCGGAQERADDGSPQASGTIVTVIGTGNGGADGVDGRAADAELYEPVGLAFDEAGNLYIAERFGTRIVKVDGSGTLTVVAGGGESQPGDGGPATEARLDGASGVAIGPDGNLYIAETTGHRIRLVDESGTITTIAGTGEQGYEGDGGPAARAVVNTPVGGIAFDPNGNLYFTDQGGLAVRMIDRDGMIATIAGGGSQEPSEGIRATDASFGNATDHMYPGLAFDPAGQLLISDVAHNRVWTLDGDGLLRVFAGNGEAMSSGDGGPASQAGVAQPLGIAVAPGGGVYIATHGHADGDQLVRMVDPDGTITTIAGTGNLGYGGDGGSATEAKLFIPAAVALDRDGDIYVADAGNHVVRKIAA